MREGPGKDDFEPHVMETFEVRIEGSTPVEVELTEIQDQSAGLIESFSLLFRGGKNRVFHQGTYRLAHGTMGEFLLFLGPVDVKRTDGVYYEAVFNRFKPG